MPQEQSTEAHALTCYLQSQNCRGWKGPPETESNHPAEQGHPGQAAWEHIPLGLESLFYTALSLQRASGIAVNVSGPTTLLDSALV